MLKILKRLVRLTVVTGISIMVLVLSFGNPANAADYHGGGVTRDGQKTADTVDVLVLTPGEFTKQICNTGSNGILTLKAPPSGTNYTQGTILQYAATGGLRCKLTVTKMIGPSKYNVTT